MSMSAAFSRDFDAVTLSSSPDPPASSGGLIGVLTDHLNRLIAAGVRATLDPRSANPPCVLLIPPAVALDVACGGTATFTAYAITRGPGNLDAWKSLDDLTSKAAAVLPVESFEPGSYALDETAPLPAFVLTWTEALEWP